MRGERGKSDVSGGDRRLRPTWEIWSASTPFLFRSSLSWAGLLFVVKNFSNILYFATVFLCWARGEMFVISITGGIDLSPVGMPPLAAAADHHARHARLEERPRPVAHGRRFGLFASSRNPGRINGILVARFRVPPFIATLACTGWPTASRSTCAYGFPIDFLPPQAVEKIGNSFVRNHFPAGASPSSAGRRALPRKLARRNPRHWLMLYHRDRACRLRLHPRGRTSAGHLREDRRAAIARGDLGGNQRAAPPREGLPALLPVRGRRQARGKLLPVLYRHFTTMSASYQLFAIAAVVIGGKPHGCRAA